MVSEALAMRAATGAALLLALLLTGCASFQEPVQRAPAPERAPAEREPEAAEPEDAESDPVETAAYIPPEPEPLVREYPRSAEAVSGPAVTSLHRQAMQQARAGEHASAIAVLERALRIEPRNAFVWTALAEQHLASGDRGQAEQVAGRANGFARGNPYLEARNWRVIADARRDGGDAQGAEQAQERAEQARMRQSSSGG